MTAQSSLTVFCDKRGISGQIKAAFGAYIRSVYAKRFLMSSDGETIHLMINQMDEEELQKVWAEFVKDLARYLTQSPE